MRIFKATRKTPDGREVAYEKWYIEIRDVRGKARRFVGYRDRRLSEDLGRKLDLLVATVKNRDALRPDLARWLESAPQNMREHLLRCGLIEQRQAAAGTSLEDLLGRFIAHLRAKRRTDQYIGEMGQALRRLFAGCRFEAWSDCEAGALEGFLSGLKQEGLSARTVNTYLAAFRAFSNFLVNREIVQPVPGFKAIKPLNWNEDRRRIRRALTADELERLFEAARERPLAEAVKLNRGADKGKLGAMLTPGTIEKLKRLGETRRLVYRIAFGTGLRRSELGSIRVADVRFRSIPPKIVLDAANEKSRKGSELPLRADLARELGDFIERRGLAADDLVFGDFPSPRTFRRDLEAAGVALVDERGRIADFHCLRTSMGSHLAAAGVPVRTTQELMRHSTVELTMRHYSDAAILDLAGALNSLPGLDAGGKANHEKRIG